MVKKELMDRQVHQETAHFPLAQLDHRKYFYPLINNEKAKLVIFRGPSGQPGPPGPPV